MYIIILLLIIIFCLFLIIQNFYKDSINTKLSCMGIRYNYYIKKHPEMATNVMSDYFKCLYQEVETYMSDRYNLNYFLEYVVKSTIDDDKAYVALCEKLRSMDLGENEKELRKLMTTMFVFNRKYTQRVYKKNMFLAKSLFRLSGFKSKLMISIYDIVLKTSKFYGENERQDLNESIIIKSTDRADGIYKSLLSI